MANKNERKPTRTDIPSPERQAAFTRLMCRFIIADDDDLVVQRDHQQVRGELRAAVGNFHARRDITKQQQQQQPLIRYYLDTHHMFSG
jgi:hypothetical protein